MSNEFVVYHNDANRVSLGNLGENEARLLFALFEKLKNKQQEILTFELDEIKSLINKNYFLRDKEITRIVKGLWDKIKTANFWILLPKRDENIMLFKTFAINYYDDNKDLVKSIEIGINEKFEYLLNNIIGNFTTFELEEFQALSGKYAQTLYRLLKQYKGTGYVKFYWDKFIDIMNIPKSYRQFDVDRLILDPAIGELTKELILSSGKCIPFHNLTYTKIKDKSQRGRGGKVVGIEFSFEKQLEFIDPRTKDEKIRDLKEENSQLLLEKSQVALEKEQAKKEVQNLKEINNRLQDQTYHIEYNEYTDLRIDKADKFKKIQTSHIVKVVKKKNEVVTTSKRRYYLYVEFLNTSNNTQWSMIFEDIEHLCNYIRKQTLTEETSKHNFKLSQIRKFSSMDFVMVNFDLRKFFATEFPEDNVKIL